MAKKDEFGSWDPKELKAFIAEMERGKKETSAWRDVLEGFSSTFFGFSASAFFKEVPKSAQQIAIEFRAANEAMGKLQKAGVDFQMAFQNTKITDSMGNTRSAIESVRSSLRNTITSGTKGMDDVMAKMEMAAQQSGSVWDNLSLEEQAKMAKLLTEEGFEFLNVYTDIRDKAQALQDIMFDEEESIIKSNKNLLKQLATHESIRDVMEGQVDALGNAEEKYKNLVAEFNSKSKKPSLIEAINNGLEEMSRNFLQKIMTNLNEVDTGIHEIQRTTGVMMAENTKGLSRWTSGIAQFGLSIKDATELMSGLGDEIRTTDRTQLMGAVDSFKSLSLALGISSQEITKIGGEMMRAGDSAEDVKNYFAFANKSAKMLGVNSKNVVKQIAGNIEKMRQFGFEGGIKGLTKMAAKAESLRIQVDEIFDVAKRARTIEGAMDMASQLQLAGGSFSNINPMELLSAARKGPEELGKILTTMGKDVGHWSDDMKTYEFNPIDVDRLQIVADATGMSLDSIQKVIQKNAQINKKTELIPESMFSSAAAGLEGLDGELAKSMLGDFLEIGKNGEIVLSADSSKMDLLSKAGIKEYSDINESTLHEFLNLKKEEGRTLEEQAKQNRGLSDTFNAFTASMTNLFTVLQPVLQGMTNVISFASDVLHKAVDKLNNVFDGLGDYLVPTVLAAVTIFKSGVGNIIKGAIATIGGKLKFGKKDAEESGGIGGLAGSMRQASDHAGGIKMGNILKFAAALGIIGLSVIGFMAGLNAIGGTPGLAQLAGAAGSMLILGGGIWALSKLDVSPGNAIKMALAMAVLGAAMIPFAYAMSLMQDVGWETMLASIGVMALSVVGLLALGALLAGPQLILLGIGALALIAVGASMAIAGAGLLVASDAFESLANINWGGIMTMGAVMLSVAPAMLAFSLASMAFANPIAMIGMGLMTLQLLGLSLVMVPLSAALSMSSQAMEKFVTSMDKLKSGVRGVDLGGIFDGVANALEKMNDALECSDMDKITQALSSIQVNIDTSSVDGLRNAISSMPSIIVHVDRSEMDRITASLSSMKLGIDLGGAKKELASLPSAQVSFDAKSMSEEMKGLPPISVKFDLKALTDAVASVPPLSIGVEEKDLMNLMSSAPVLKATVDTSDLSAAMKALPSLTVGVDEKAFGDAVSNLPALNIGVDAKQIKEALSAIPAVSMTIDTQLLMEKLNTLPSVTVSIDVQSLMDQLAKVSDIRIGLDLSAMTDVPSLSLSVDMARVMEQLDSIKEVRIGIDLSALSNVPPISVAVDTKGFIEQLSGLPSIGVRVDTASLISAMSSVPPLMVSADITSLMKQLSEMPSIHVGVDLSVLSQIPPVSVVLDGASLREQLAGIPEVKLSIDVSGLMKQLSEIPSMSMNVDTQKLLQQLASLPSVPVSVDINTVIEQLTSLPSVSIMVDAGSLLRQLEEVPAIRLGFDTDGLAEAMASIPSISIGIDQKSFADILDSIPSIPLRVDEDSARKAVAALPSLELSIDTEKILASMPRMNVVIDQKAILDAFAAIPSLTVRIDMSEVQDLISGLPPVSIGFQLDGLQEMYAMVSDSQPIEVIVDTTELMGAIDLMKDANVVVDASQVYEAVASIPAIRLMVDATSITDQLGSLPPFIIGVDRTEIDKMAMLLSSIRVSLDVSGIESAVSGLKIGVDTTQLDRSVSDLRAINMDEISGALASIEATIGRVNESKMSGVKVVSEDLGATNSKMQMEMMAQLTAALDKLSTSASKESQGDRKIIIELEMDGRQMRTKILKDTSIVT